MSRSKSHFIAISINNKKWYDYIDKAFIYKVFKAVVHELDVQRIEISLIMADNVLLRKLNKQYRNKDTSTNVLAFVYQAGSGYIGDIAIALQTVLYEASDFKINVRDYTAHMIIHGMLHIMGYDHQTIKQAMTMELLEKKLLTKLNYRTIISSPLDHSITKVNIANKH